MDKETRKKDLPSLSAFVGQMAALLRKEANTQPAKPEKKKKMEKIEAKKTTLSSVNKIAQIAKILRLEAQRVSQKKEN